MRGDLRDWRLGRVITVVDRGFSSADNLEVKEARLGSGGPRRFVVCHNPAEADKDRAQREEKLARIEAELARIASARERDRRAEKKNSDEAHVRAESMTKSVSTASTCSPPLTPSSLQKT